LAACGGEAATPAKAEPTKAGAQTAAAPTAAAPTAASAATKPAEPTKAPAPAAASGPQKLVYWGAFGGNLGKAQEEVVKRYNDSQKEITVEHQFQGSYEELANKLTAALQAKQAPDLAVLSDVWWYKFYLNRAIQPLDDLMKTEKVDTKDFVDPFFNEYVQDGKSYALPFARSTPLFYYNKDAYKKAGLPDRAPKTWDEFTKDFAPKLKSSIDSTHSVFANGGYSAWVFQGVIWQFGGAYSDKDFKMLIGEPKGVQAGEFYRSSIKDGWSVSVKSDGDEFKQGLTTSVINSTGGLVGILDAAKGKFEVGTGFLPEGPAGFGCPTGGAGVSLLSGMSADKQAAAMKYLAFATSPDLQAWWSQNTGYMPVRKSAIDGKSMQDFIKTNPNSKTALDQLPKTKFQDSARVFVPNGDQIIAKGLERILVNKDAPADVFKEVAATLEKEAAPVIAARKARGA
jgi:sn-glycerol 3-phosphate transport system substrate-binding protein